MSSLNHVPAFEFFSRPDIRAPLFTNITIYDESKLAPGYIFLTPGTYRPCNIQAAPTIYDNSGELIWSGADLNLDGYRSFDLQVCEYLGSPHLCFTWNHPDLFDAGPLAMNIILDNHYQQSAVFANEGKFADKLFLPDLHEFSVHGEPLKESFIGTVQMPFRVGPVEVAGCDSWNTTLEFVRTGLFMDRGPDGEFIWNSIDHIHPSETVVCPGQNFVVGKGHTLNEAFDYFHINSVEKDPHGDYIISARHASTIYKIAGANSPKPGSVIWRFGGPKSDFDISSDFEDVAKDFKFQHHARIDNSIPGATQAGMLGLAIFDNANSEEGFGDASWPFSSGKTYLLDTTDFTATLVGAYYAPEGHLSASTGSHQVLPNGNHLLGYGNLPYVAEVDGDNNPVYSATYGPDFVGSYRAFRFEWEGYSSKPPALFAFARECGAPVSLYASMNGQTNVAFYRFYTSHSKKSQDFRLAAEANKTGFETLVEAEYNVWAVAEAFDADGNSLGKSAPAKVFVPSTLYASGCSDRNCGYGFNYTNAATAVCDDDPAATIAEDGHIPPSQGEDGYYDDDSMIADLQDRLYMLEAFCAILLIFIIVSASFYCYKSFFVFTRERHHDQDPEREEEVEQTSLLDRVLPVWRPKVKYQSLNLLKESEHLDRFPVTEPVR